MGVDPIGLPPGAPPGCMYPGGAPGVEPIGLPPGAPPGAPPAPPGFMPGGTIPMGIAPGADDEAPPPALAVCVSPPFLPHPLTITLTTPRHVNSKRRDIAGTYMRPRSDKLSDKTSGQSFRMNRLTAIMPGPAGQVEQQLKGISRVFCSAEISCVDRPRPVPTPGDRSLRRASRRPIIRHRRGSGGSVLRPGRTPPGRWLS